MLPCSTREACRVLLCTLGFAALLPSATGERLPIRAYGTADGLPSNGVNTIRLDSRGYLWFATDEGLARFDGYEFNTYGRANGLPRDVVSDFLETRSGIYWVATSDGLARFNPSAPASKKFTVYRPESPDGRRVYVLYEDRLGRLWCGTEGGLFRLRVAGASGRDLQFERVSIVTESGRDAPDQRVISLFEDSRGDLWIGTFRALYRRRPNGHISEFQCRPREGDDFLWNAMLEDHQGRLWAGTGFGLWRIVPDGADGYRIVPVFVPKRRLIVWRMLEDPKGKLWLGTSGGLIEWIANQGSPPRPRIYTEANGLTNNDIATLCKDREGNLWLGSDGGGAMRIGQNGFVTYSAGDHLSFGRFTGVSATLFRDRSGEVHVAFHHIINVLRGREFIKVIPAIPRQHSSYLGWGWHQTIVQDKSGEWWIPTAEGLVRFPSVPVQALGRARPKAVYTTRNGLGTNDIFRIFEDSQGGIWIACIGPLGTNGLSRWDRRTETFRHFTEHTVTAATAFAEDHSGSVWVGYYDGALARFHSGAFRLYGMEDGLAGGGIQALHIDGAGRLWIASLRGLTRLDAPSEEHPHFRRFSVADGLSSNIVLCITEDGWGRVYLATGRGVDRINSTGRIAAGQVKHYTEADGLARGGLRDLMFDRFGVLWCASKQGLSRFRPEPDRPRASPPVFISRVRIRGVPYPLSDFGETSFVMRPLTPSQNQLQIDYGGLAFAPGDVLRYQYKLEPADHDWTEPSDDRTVNYSNVSSGTYRFSVRVITDGLVKSDPAVLQFTVLAPVWKRWWFQLLLALAALGLLYWLHHYRTLRLLELERVRTRIASDLHDDIGSGLSQIAVLAEVAKIRTSNGTPDLKSTLSNIGSVSRQLAESMNDIVWSVNPDRDRLSDLVQRMRRFSSDVLSGGIDFHFRVSMPERPVFVAADMRRELYLIFKEAVNNLVRHSGCTRAEIDVSIDRSSLNLRIEDNGKGLCERPNESGNGLRSMSERARRIGARIEFCPGAESGLRVTLQAPMNPRS